MNLSFEPLLHRSPADISEVLNHAFEGYIMPANFRPELVAYMVRNDAIDLMASRIVLRNGKPAGIGLIARRGDRSRLAGMAVVPDARGQGVGRRLMEHLLAEAAERGEQAMELEVIEQNTAAVRLYERVGFKQLRRLVGFVAEPNAGAAAAGLQEAPLMEVAAKVLASGWPDLPWQISGGTLAQYTHPAKGYRLGPALAVLSGCERPTVTIQAIIVEPEHRRQGHATRLLQALQAEYAHKSWRVPIVYPEEFADGLFLPLGFQREKYSQFQMLCLLSRTQS